MDFETFKASEPAQSMFRRLGMAEILEQSETWRELQRNVVDFNDYTGGNGHFVDRVQKAAGKMSSGERVLLNAICHATDFSWLANKLDTKDRKSVAWTRMDFVSGTYRQAVAACIAQVD